ncbi:hypothetical protein E4U48_004020 [Claviceps purpurea]|nr:hypothetical protein E4U48_004020 [Claviceps purpurea]
MSHAQEPRDLLSLASPSVDLQRPVPPHCLSLMSATTESNDTPCSDCENTRSERRVAEDLQRMSMNQTATVQLENQALGDEIWTLRSQRTLTAATESGSTNDARPSSPIPLN